MEPVAQDDGTDRDGADRRPEPLLRTALGEVLRRERARQRRTLLDVADRARVSVPYLSEVERGRKEASSEVLAAVCAALGLELSDALALTARELATGRAVRGRARRLEVVREQQRDGTRRAMTSIAPRPTRTGGPTCLAA